MHGENRLARLALCFRLRGPRVHHRNRSLICIKKAIYPCEALSWPGTVRDRPRDRPTWKLRAAAAFSRERAAGRRSCDRCMLNFSDLWWFEFEKVSSNGEDVLHLLRFWQFSHVGGSEARSQLRIPWRFRPSMDVSYLSSLSGSLQVIHLQFFSRGTGVVGA